MGFFVNDGIWGGTDIGEWVEHRPSSAGMILEVETGDEVIVRSVRMIEVCAVEGQKVHDVWLVVLPVCPSWYKRPEQLIGTPVIVIGYNHVFPMSGFVADVQRDMLTS